MTKPKVRVNLNGATELLNRRIPASCKHQSRSHAEGRESGKWIGLLCPLGFRDSLIVSPHRRQEPTVVRVSVRIVGTQFNGSFEFLFRCGPIPVIPVRDDRHGNVSPRIGFIDGERPLGRILGLGPGFVPFCSGLFRGRLSTDSLYQRQASVVTEKVLNLS